MKCPTDGADLVMSERQGVEIDYCPTCRGVWLDRGELDKIIDRAADVLTTSPPPPPPPPPPPAPPAPSPYAVGGGDAPHDRDPRYDQQRYDQPRYDQPRYDKPRYDRPRYDDKGYDQRGQRRKKESWLGEIFDF